MSRQIRNTEKRYIGVGNTPLRTHENTFQNSASSIGVSNSLIIQPDKLLEHDLIESKKFSQLNKESTLRATAIKSPFAFTIVHLPDDREPILKTNFPYNIICLLSISSKYYRDTLKGTGFFISKRCIITAGHCVFYNNTWMDSITVIPGAIGNYAPVGQAESSFFRSVEGWTENKNSNFDYGAIILEDDTLYNKLNAQMGYRVSDRMTNIEIAGYPEDKEQIPHLARGKINSKTTYRFYYDVDTEEGNSGSPIYHYDENNIQAVGIHTDGANPDNYGIRFRQEIIDRFNEWILL